MIVGRAQFGCQGFLRAKQFFPPHDVVRNGFQSNLGAEKHHGMFREANDNIPSIFARPLSRFVLRDCICRLAGAIFVAGSFNAANLVYVSL